MTLAISAQTLTVEITNIRNNKENINLAIFIDSSSSSFDLGKPFIEKHILKLI